MSTSQPASPTPPSRSGMPGSPFGGTSPGIAAAAASQPDRLLPADPGPAGRLPASALAAHRPLAAAAPQPASPASRAPASARGSAAAVTLLGRWLSPSRRAPNRLAASRLDAGLRQGLSGPVPGLPASRAAEGELAAVRDDADEPDVRRGMPHGRAPLRDGLQLRGELSVILPEPPISLRCPSRVPARHLGSSGKRRHVGHTECEKVCNPNGTWEARGHLAVGCRRRRASTRAGALASPARPARRTAHRCCCQGCTRGVASAPRQLGEHTAGARPGRGRQAGQQLRPSSETTHFAEHTGAAGCASCCCGSARTGPDQRSGSGQGQPPSACQRQTRATQGTCGDALQRTPADKRHPDAGINLIRCEGLG